MIRGTVNANREANIHVSVLNQAHQKEGIEAIIDTGFTGDLTLPRDRITDLRLVWLGREQGILADGSLKLFDVYSAKAFWDGQVREVEIEAVDGQPLLGMKLLEGWSLQIDVIHNGAVSITPL